MTESYEFDVDAALAAISRPGRHQMRSEALSGANPSTQLSQLSQFGRRVATLSPELRDAYEERAAIIEFDGELERPHAEKLALAEILKRFGHLTGAAAS